MSNSIERSENIVNGRFMAKLKHQRKFVVTIVFTDNFGVNDLFMMISRGEFLIVLLIAKK
jgi:hypothetical protein